MVGSKLLSDKEFQLCIDTIFKQQNEKINRKCPLCNIDTDDNNHALLCKTLAGTHKSNHQQLVTLTLHSIHPKFEPMESVTENVMTGDGKKD